MMIDYSKIKNSLWWKSYSLIRQNSKLALYIFILDLMFIALLYGFSFVSQQILPEDPSVYFQFGSSGALIISVSIALVYILIMIFIYSFFKYGVLDMIHSMIRNTKFDFGKLVKFYKLNIVVFGLPFLVFVLFYVVTLLALRREVQPVISWIFLIIVAIFAYPYYNIAHTLFTRNYDIKKILGISLKLTLRKFKNYIVVYFFSILGVG